MRKLVCAVLLCLAATVPSAAAQGAVQVHFGVAALTYAPGPCPVEVPEGADGVAVLEAAKQAGCILDYRTNNDFGEPFLECVNFICGYPSSPATYWALYYDGVCAEVGLAGFRAGANRELVVSYQQFLVPTAPVGCY